MKLAIISDVHANLTALNAVLNDCKKRYGKIKFLGLGDYIDYGMRPNEVIEKLQSLDFLVNLKGNHERAFCGYEVEKFSSKRGIEANNYTKKILNEKSKKYLKSLSENFLELEIDDKKILCVHGDLTDVYWGKMTDEEIKKEIYKKYDYVISGHTHISSLRTVINNDKTHKILFINAGSVGQPRNLNNNAQYCIIDFCTNTIEFNSVPYDIKLEQSLYHSQIDEYYKDRLILGI